MKWKVKKYKHGWGIFLLEEYSKTKEEICYGVSINKVGAKRICNRLNSPLHVDKL